MRYDNGEEVFFLLRGAFEKESDLRINSQDAYVCIEIVAYSFTMNQRIVTAIIH